MRVDDDFGFDGKLIRFKDPQGALLHGFEINHPKGKVRTAVIYLHGLNSSFYRSPTTLAVGTRIAKMGLVFLSIEQRGSYRGFYLTMEKNGKRRSTLQGGDVERFEDCVLDIKGAVDYLKSRGVRGIYLYGSSTGCQKAVYYMSRTNDRSVKGLILLGPADDYNIWKNDSYNLWGKNKKRMFKEVVEFARKKARADPNYPMGLEYKGIGYSAARFLSFADPRNVEARIFNYDLPKLEEFSKVRVPILAVLGSDEEWMNRNAEEYIIMLKNNSRSGFVGAVVFGAPHGFSGKANELSDIVLDWLKKR